jgi:hypothetical protein
MFGIPGIDYSIRPPHYYAIDEKAKKRTVVNLPITTSLESQTVILLHETKIPNAILPTFFEDHDCSL